MLAIKSHIGPYISNGIKFGYSYRRAIAERKAFELLSEQNKNEYIKGKVLNKVREAFDKSVFYNELYRFHNVDPHKFKEISDLSYLPIISKKDFLEKTDQLLLSDSDKSKLITANTGGSTGNPLKLYRSNKEVAEEYAYLDFYLKNVMKINGRKKIIIRGNCDKSNVLKRFGCNLILSSQLINEGNIEYVVSAIKSFSPDLVHAYPSSILKLTDLISRKNLDVNIPNILTSSEKISKQQLDLLKFKYNANFIDLYGNSEHSVLAINTSGDYVFDLTYGYTEFVEGKIISTKLLSSPMPLIRYDCGDTYLNESVKSNELSNKALDSIGGRNVEYVYDNKNNQLPVVSIILGQHYDFFNSVTDYSLVQNKPGELMIEYISNSALSSSDINSAIDKMNTITNFALKLKFKKVDKIRLLNNGKKAFIYRGGTDAE
ncbi:hypothetical protein ACHELS_001474 [Vibrio vulnificus]|nr:hypothetical protein [Vibrio vulnificus]ELS3556115.1 hypothetical protein [Vibrio vulnificus]ELS9098782.1 hypothetical protein [Vibrio vulnificus]